MSEIRRLGNRTKFSLDFRHSGRSVRSIVWLYYKLPKSERLVGRVDQPNARNPNCLGMGRLWKAPKSKHSDFKHLLYISTYFYSYMYYKTVHFSVDLQLNKIALFSFAKLLLGINTVFMHLSYKNKFVWLFIFGAFTWQNAL